ncbi:MvdC/MvdD family ATP grasp protein [Streptomyces erythrochromogenes]|uniref:MvdC/MvdD family ATP grasp protein n=1 Tax=Streptomyces erythrochromogenes TaxID=285574 RepID=UPI00131E311F|nr:hypothetical protein [Streptomyces erythrochromogenes]
MILIISEPDCDGHIAPVTAELSRRGEDFRIYDPAMYPASSTITIESAAAGTKTSLSWDGNVLDLSCVKSVWYRRPGKLALSDQLTAEEGKWIRSECNHLLRATWAGMRSRWVSRPEAIRSASVKVSQLKVAADIGFTIPRYTVTNDVDSATEFISSCREGVVVKVLTDPFIAYSDRWCRLYTHLLSADDLDKVESIRFGPTFLQEFIQKTMDVRVTVFGEEVFAVGIKSAEFEEARVDFRRAEVYDLPHSIVTLPEHLNSFCTELVRRLGLRFGAIDFVLTPDGQYFFLEINPNGQWYWLELVTGVPLTRSLCSQLACGSDVN